MEIMAKKTNKITIPKEVATLPQPTNEPVQPMTGSPTTGNSGLVNKKVSSVTKQKRTPNVKSKAAAAATSNNNELRISEKRMLAHTLTRKLTSQEPNLSKVLRYLANKNILVNPVIQKLNYSVQVNNNVPSLFISLEPSTQLNGKEFNELSKLIADYKVVPLSDPTDKVFSIQIIESIAPDKKRKVSKRY